MDEEEPEPLVVVGVERLVVALLVTLLAVGLVWDGRLDLCAAPLGLLAVALVGAVASDTWSRRAP